MKNRILSVKKLLLYFTIASAFCYSSCKKKANEEIKQPQIVFKKEGELILYKNSSDTIVKQLDIEIADNDYETQTGLMYRVSMEDSEGMLFVFEDSRPHSFYMKNTNFPLDIIYIGENKKIVSTQLNAKPRDESSLPSNANAKYVLEINAGLFDKWELKIGDSISYIKQ